MPARNVFEWYAGLKAIIGDGALFLEIPACGRQASATTPPQDEIRVNRARISLIVLDLVFGVLDIVFLAGGRFGAGGIARFL